LFVRTSFIIGYIVVINKKGKSVSREFIKCFDALNDCDKYEKIAMSVSKKPDELSDSINTKQGCFHFFPKGVLESDQSCKDVKKIAQKIHYDALKRDKGLEKKDVSYGTKCAYYNNEAKLLVKDKLFMGTQGKSVHR
jgi:hypothetical protein